jgi:hypothetical protein
MNRAHRRAAHRQAPREVRSFAVAYRCPDCLSETTQPVADQFGMWHVEVHHDGTCPTYRRLRAEGWAPGQREAQ